MPTIITLGSGVDPSETTATASDVVTPKQFLNSDGELISGTLANRGGSTQTANVSANGSNIQMTIPAVGYYTTSSKLQAAASTFGNAAASEVKIGRTFTSSAGLRATGTLNGSALAHQFYVSEYLAPNTTRSTAVKDFGSSYKVKVNMLCVSSPGKGLTISLQGSNDNSNWSQIASSTTSSAGSASTYYSEGTSTAYRYYKVEYWHNNSSYTSNGCSFAVTILVVSS